MGKGEQTRQEIIRKAAPIFNQRGYEGTALSELMKATGLEKGGIYRHFESKEQLAAEAFDYAWGETLRARTYDLDVLENSVDQLKQMVTNFVERRGIIPGGCPLLNTAVDSDDGNSKLRERAREALSGWRERIVGIVRSGINKREIRTGADPKAIAITMIAGLEGAVMLSLLEKNDKPLRIVRGHLQSYLESNRPVIKSKRDFSLPPE